MTAVRTRVHVSVVFGVEPGGRVRRWRHLPWPTRTVAPDDRGWVMYQEIRAAVTDVMARHGYRPGQVDGDGSQVSVDVEQGWFG